MHDSIDEKKNIPYSDGILGVSVLWHLLEIFLVVY